MSGDDTNALAIISIFGLPVVAFIVARVLRHRERMEMIRHGFPPDGKAYRRSWNAGAPPAPDACTSDSSSDDPQRLLYRGIRTACIGVALTVGLSFIGSDSDGPLHTFSVHPGPWLLGGLIPMFVGIAQIASAIIAGAQIGAFGRIPPQQINFPPPPPYRPSAASPPDPAPSRGADARSPYEPLNPPVPPPRPRP